MSIPARQIHTETLIAPNRRVLVVTDTVNGCADMVRELRSLGLDVMMSAYDGAAITHLPERAPAAALCILSDYIEHGAAIVSDLRTHYDRGDFPILGHLTRESRQDHPYDSVLFAPVHAVQVARRLSSMIRLGQMEREIVRRIDTLRHGFGVEHTLSSGATRQPFRVLFVGRADPAYMTFVNAMQGRNAQIVAAFTSFSAFDYLHESEFDAVIISALNSTEPALTIASTLRRNPRHFHVPVLALVDPGNPVRIDTDPGAGIHDVIESDRDADEISGRVLELANAYRLHRSMKQEFDDLDAPACRDAATGVFNGAFLNVHLKRVSRDCRARQMPLCILTLKLVPQCVTAVSGKSISQAFDRGIKLVAKVVRMEDIVARLDDATIIVAFPEQRRIEVDRIANRLVAMLEDAAFTSDDRSDESLTLSVDHAVVEQDDWTSHDAASPFSPVSLVG
ncbi:MAG: hypothetical protein WBF53_14765 [Litorimonas sp.]